MSALERRDREGEDSSLRSDKSAGVEEVMALKQRRATFAGESSFDGQPVELSEDWTSVYINLEVHHGLQDGLHSF